MISKEELVKYYIGYIHALLDYIAFKYDIMSDILDPIKILVARAIKDLVKELQSVR